MDLYKKAEKRMKTALDEYRGFAQYQGKGVYGSKQLKGKMRVNKNAALREAKTQDAINDKLGFLNRSKRDEVLKVVNESKKK